MQKVDLTRYRKSSRGKPICRCGQGIASAMDGKCGHCRTSRERASYHFFMWGKGRKTWEKALSQ